MILQEYKVLHLFCGLGGAALGMQEAVEEYRGQVGRFVTLAGIDNDPEACRDFEYLTGAPAVEMDLFGRQQYIDFHGAEPPADWREADQYDLLRATGGECPDVIFTSPPCKGLSGLLPEKSAKSRKYQALNRLVVRGFELALQAYQDDLPAVILLENVPRITSRGKGLLKEVKVLLGRHGYEFAEGYHDCGEIGGLGQRRKRFLLIARNRQKMANFIYQPPVRKLKTIGDVIGPLPMPDDPMMGPMHRLPRLQWKTWVRLALIPAGGDWRDLEDLGHHPRGGAWAVVPWEQTGGTVTGSARVGGSNGMAAVADPRLETIQGYGNKFRVDRFTEPAGTVTGSRLGSGAPIVADPRTGFKPGTHQAIYQVRRWDEPGSTVTGAMAPSNGAPSVADPRMPEWSGGWKRSGAVCRVNSWDKPTDVVMCSAHLQGSGAVAVADPRLNIKPRSGTFGVQAWDEPGKTVIGSGDIHAGAAAVADPRLTCIARHGAFGVSAWGEPAKTVGGSADIHSSGSNAVADPRIPGDNERLDPPPLIISDDGTWHRPLTTLELAALQGFPVVVNGKPLKLAGNSDARHRERIGNAVPPPAARAMADQILMALQMSETAEFTLNLLPIWVAPEDEQDEIRAGD